MSKMKLIETLIPSKLKQKVSEVESWTLKWEIGNKKHYKVFIKKEDLNEYWETLRECAKFLNIHLNTYVINNTTGKYL
jgi:small nuclear ribonucleoprotein (snRNP)-like protein